MLMIRMTIMSSTKLKPAAERGMRWRPNRRLAGGGTVIGRHFGGPPGGWQGGIGPPARRGDWSLLISYSSLAISSHPASGFRCRVGAGADLTGEVDASS